MVPRTTVQTLRLTKYYIPFYLFQVTVSVKTAGKWVSMILKVVLDAALDSFKHTAELIDKVQQTLKEARGPPMCLLLAHLFPTDVPE
eukprot:4459229-Amphidinium_carterae.1